VSEDAGPPDRPTLMAEARLTGIPNSSIATLCIELAEVAGAGISLMTSAGNSGMLYASDDKAAKLEELQFDLGEGPCMDAFAGDGPVFIADLRDPEEGALRRWPGFVQGAAGLGVRAVYAVPLRIGAIRLGVMDLYRTRPGMLSPVQLESALLAADLAALSLLHATNGAIPYGESAVNDSTFRMSVHQATGMVKVQTGLPMEDALLLLRAHAYAQGQTVAEVAAQVIARTLSFVEEDP
jgi:hypothetical protein